MHSFGNGQWTKLKRNKMVIYKGIKKSLFLYEVITTLFT